MLLAALDVLVSRELTRLAYPAERSRPTTPKTVRVSVLLSLPVRTRNMPSKMAKERSR